MNGGAGDERFQWHRNGLGEPGAGVGRGNAIDFRGKLYGRERQRRYGHRWYGRLCGTGPRRRLEGVAFRSDEKDTKR